MFELYPYQKPIAEKVFTYMRDNPGKHPLVAMPTGSGKTVVLSDIIEKAISKWPETKVLVLSHVKEILEQDYRSIKFHTGRDVGIYSAGLKKREVKQITVAGIQSVHRQTYLFKDFDLIIIDECHLIPPADTSMYRGFFMGLEKPRYLGLTATPFRLGAGLIYGQPNSIFNELIYDLTSSDKFLQLIKDGYLCDLKTQATKSEMDPTNISTKGGDFDQSEMSMAFNRDELTKAAVKEIVKLGENCKKWLVFAIDIPHAEAIATNLIRAGVPTMIVHSKMSFDRDWAIDTFKKGKFRAIVNVNVLTTGFDDPEIDLIALLRPTKSPVIHVQTIGRGLRIAKGKDHCLVLDFAGNTERLGPINDIVVRKTRKGQHPDEVGEAPTKKCPNCEAILPIRDKKCKWCGHEFPAAEKIRASHSKHDVILRNKKIDWYDVTETMYHLHQKSLKPSMVKVSYRCGMRVFNEYVCIEHPQYAGHRARHWVRFRGGSAETAAELLKESPTLKQPKRVKMDTRGKYPVVIDVEF